MLFCNRWNRELFTSTFAGKNPLIRQTRRRFTLSSELKWTNEIHFYCFLLKPIRDGLAPGSPQSSSLPGRHARKSSGSRLFRCLFATISPLVWKKASTIFRKLYLNFNVSFNSLGCCYVIVSKCPFVRCSRRRKHFLPQTNSVWKHHLVRRTNL